MCGSCATFSRASPRGRSFRRNMLMTRRTRALLVALSGALLGGFAAPKASAQVIYEPVRYEFGSGEYKFYYGGHDARVFRHVEADVDRMTYGSSVTRRPVV